MNASEQSASDRGSHSTPALYDAIAGIYDPWSASVTEDIGYYVETSLDSAGPVVELACGTGRIAVPIAKAGRRVIGVDQSAAMLDMARAYAEREGVGARLDLRLGDVCAPPVPERVPLVICPFRSLLHLEGDAAKLRALCAAAALLEPGGRFVFDVFAPSREDIEETDGRWLEREPGIWERADWDEAAHTLVLSVRSGDADVSFALHWLDHRSWERLILEAGLVVESLHGWFDRRPFSGGEDMIWVCRRP
ncbi:MAG: class I SAM-dependent methyltransferase [Thermoleophilia bacterium]|nr:class I SAM-dependent methyltransferase [Thermoleophilia bacterium]MDH4345167.1 class I SAM-dependent methyltransferase [Thermoleophilia bacterium]MDH5332771.1 class I SAM-dependent methyltransferase [Thermoleophilia bacterium]